MDSNNVAQAFRNAFASHGLEINEADANPLMGYHKPLAIQLMLEKIRVDPDPEFIEEIHADFEKEMVDFYEYDPAVKPMPGAEDIFTVKGKRNPYCIEYRFFKADCGYHRASFSMERKRVGG